MDFSPEENTKSIWPGQENGKNVQSPDNSFCKNYWIVQLFSKKEVFHFHKIFLKKFKFVQNFVCMSFATSMQKNLLSYCLVVSW